jgi:glycosyltransferase 2 family protein
VIFIAVVLYLVNNFDSVIEQIQTVSPLRLLAAAGGLILGRLLLVEQARRATTLVGWTPTYRRMLFIRAVSELGKYLPGGIWHYVGRTGFYRAGGLSLKDSGKAVLIENLWMALASGLVGLLFCLIYFLGTAALFVNLLLLVIGLLALRILSRLLGTHLNWQAALTTLLLQLAIWSVLGMSLWVLVPNADPPADFALVVGAFCLSWVIGFLVFFAPSGIGVREVVLVTLMAAAFPPESVLIYAGIHRLGWTLTEVLLALVANLLDSFPTQSQALPTHE